jgi:arsenate reductase (glutaredoxin)
MADITIYQKPTCTTCKEVYQILKEANVNFDAVDYFTDPIPKAKLKELIQKLGLPVEELIRKKDQLFSDLRLGEKKLTEGQWLDLLAIYPDLLQRPIVERGGKAIVARPARKIREFLMSTVAVETPEPGSTHNACLPARQAQGATEKPNVAR